MAYARISTKEQAEKGLSIPAQLKAIREIASPHGFRILEEYIDEEESAKTNDGPEFRKIIKRCQKDKNIEAVIVHKIDRFLRNNIDFYAYKAILKRFTIILSYLFFHNLDSKAQFISNTIFLV